MRPRTLGSGSGPKLRLSMTSCASSASLSASTQQWPCKTKGQLFPRASLYGQTDR